MQLSGVGKYQIRAPIGRGAVGIVYNGWDTVLARDVAIKVLPLDSMSEEGQEKRLRFLREAQAAASLYHPNIVGVYDYGETEDIAYIVMELISGEPLDALLQTGVRLPLTEVSAIMSGLLAGLQHSHSRGVVHRDIKPSNIILTTDRVVKITDFGIAHLESSEMTRVGAVLGTPAYMSPEQVLGDHIDTRTDLYSAGVMLYQMLLGRRPFEGGTASIMHRIVNSEPVLPAQPSGEVPAGIASILMKALSKRPDDRYGSAAEFSEVLQRHLVSNPSSLAAMDTADVTVTAAPPAVIFAGHTAVIAARRSGQAKGFALVGFAVVAAAGGYLWWKTGRQHSPQPFGTASTVVVQPMVASVPVPLSTTSPPQEALSSVDPPPIAPGLASALNDAGLAIPCTLLVAETDQQGHLNLQGLTALGGSAELQVRSSISRVAGQILPNATTSWNLQRVSGPYCGLLDVLRGAPRSGAIVPVLLTQASGGVVKVGTLGLPIDAVLSIDFYTPDHSVAHLTSGILPAVLPGGPGLVVLIASRPALTGNTRPTQEPAAGYLDELRAAFTRARSEGQLITIGAASVEGASR